MNMEFEDEDEVFYGGGSSQPSKPQKTRTYHPEPETEQEEEQQPERELSEAEIEDQIRRTRHDKMRAAEYHDVTRLRQKGAEHRADAAKFFKKYRAEEADMVKYQQYANKARRKSEGFMEKSKDALAKADEKQSDLEYLEGGKAERGRVKVAKLKAKSAKCMSKASKWQAKGAKATQKAAAKRQKANALLEKSKTHEAEALNFKRRADKLERI